MTVRVDNITSVDWSPRLGVIGEIVEDLDDINQCIDIILATPKGSDPHRPLFGCDAWLWLDAPPARAVPNIIVESVDSLELWEPRITIISVLAAVTAEGATITVVWQRRGSAVTNTREVTIGNTN